MQRCGCCPDVGGEATHSTDELVISHLPWMAGFPTKATCMLCSKKSDNENRQFNGEWTEKYVFGPFGPTALCVYSVVRCPSMKREYNREFEERPLKL